MSQKGPGLLSVTKAAQIAGVTPRTVRHYHSIGVLPEPPRDASGYRRYGSKEIIELVRVTRLRALGLSLPQIAEQVHAVEPDDTSLSERLTSLADELDAEIARLAATRDRLREMAGSRTLEQPAKALTEALQGQGLLGPADDLRSGERMAADVLDALHPDGMPGVLARAGRLLGDSAAMARLRPLRMRLRALNAASTDAEIAQLAADVAEVLPVEDADVQVDIGLVEMVLTDRLNPTQQRFVSQLRTHLQSREQTTR